MDLNTIWFLLVAVLISGYAVLDGFDLGVGVLHLFAKSEQEKVLHLRAIGPVWDGNEVWLLTGGGALFAAFPAVYATVSIEYRGVVDAPGWRKAFDLAFGIGSLLPSILFGVAVGNVLRGVPIDAQGNWAGSFLGLLNPYSILIGLVSLFAFVTHGALYIAFKSDGEQSARMQRWAFGSFILFLAVYALATAATAFVSPQLLKTGNPLFWVLALVLAAGLAGIPVMLKRGQPFGAFLASSLTLVAMIGEAGVGLFPRLVPSLINPDYSLTIYNSASTPLTQTVMLVIALIGMPLVIAYTAIIYRAFRGKVVLQGEGY
jgi:cytochrome bd ubiquinol oxidase subunit II